MKKTLLIFLFGFVFGTAIAGFISPSMISWYFDPPAAMGVSCKAAVMWGLGAYQKILLIGGLLGILIAAIALVVIKSKQSKTQSTDTLPPNAP